VANMKSYLKTLSQDIFSQLSSDEELNLFVHSEESQFIRFSQSKVRQNTTVHQHEISVTYQKEQRKIKFTLNLCLEPAIDTASIMKELQVCRTQLPQTDIYPQFVPMDNNGVSESIKKVDRPNDLEMLKIIAESFADSDMAGLYCSGPVRQVSINSKGQFHYFENDFFFLDYSIYNGPKAAKGFFSCEKWNEKDLRENIHQAKAKLDLLNLPTVNVTKGKYRAYIEPMALLEIIGMFSWGSLSYSVLRQGRSPFQKLQQNETSLSPKLNLIENLGLGYVPSFNSIGEVADKELNLIENGKLINLLTSTASAKEYGVPSNKADPREGLRSPEIKPGSLAQADILKKLDTGLYLSNLHYINWSDVQSARMTGMTRYACFWVEKGQIKGPIQDLRFDDSMFNLLGSNLIDLTTHQELFVESATYQKRYLGAYKLPGALIEDFNFTL
jgi:predicted Zn-dependent protease